MVNGFGLGMHGWEGSPRLCEDGCEAQALGHVVLQLAHPTHAALQVPAQVQIRRLQEPVRN